MFSLWVHLRNQHGATEREQCEVSPQILALVFTSLRPSANYLSSMNLSVTI